MIIESKIPTQYRLARRPTIIFGENEYILQGFFVWEEHLGGDEYVRRDEWRDLETVDLPYDPL